MSNTTPSREEQSRAEFETWAVSQQFNVGRHLRDESRYWSNATETAWLAWSSREAEINDLRLWKNEQLTVTAWWDEVDKFVRESPESRLGHSVAKEALRMLQQLADARKDAELMRAALKELKNWNTHDSVTGTGDYDSGLMCGVEDRGLQANGYDAMRFGYDRALERVGEIIDPIIDAALDLRAGGREVVKVSQPDFGQALRSYRNIRDEGIQDTAKRAGISKGLLSRIERGQDTQLSTMIKVLNAHGLTLYVKSK